MTAFGIFLYSASAYAVIATAEIAVNALRKKPTPPLPVPVFDPIRELMNEEQLKLIQDWIIRTLEANNGRMPLNVKRITVLFTYADGKSHHVEIGEQERMKTQL